MVREEVKGEIYWCRSYDYRYSHIQVSLHNGGLETLTDWVMDGMPIDLVERIENLPLTFSYENKDFCHAAGVYRTFKETADTEYEGKPVDEFAAESLLWSRTGLDIGWEPKRIAIFGHTPVQYLSDYTDIKIPEDMEIQPILYECTVLSRMTGKKLAMDTGAAFSRISYVLNVLTMKAQGFKLNENDNKIEKIDCIQF